MYKKINFITTFHLYYKGVLTFLQHPFIIKL
nr:MAG TPA: hypothetical protein [Caudoviricetes sp.]